MIGSLRLQDFRCFGHLALEAPAAGAIITGDNAQGKTSILEAVCVVVRLHSPRARRLAALRRFESRGFGVAADAWGIERQVRHGEEGTRLLADGGERPGPGEYLADGGLLVWLGNEDLELVRGAAELRRRYLDFLGSQLDPSYRRVLGRYRQALRDRNLLLKDPRPDQREIEAYDVILAEAGEWLSRVRAALVAALAPLVDAAQQVVAHRPETAGIAYRPGFTGGMASALAAARDRDRRLRQTTVGPHRDDLALSVAGKAAADFASEGQQRTLALALKLAQGRLLEQRRGILPVYLFDDIFGELDPGRRNALMGHLPQQAQKWVTTTHLGWLEETPGLGSLARFRLQDGRLGS